MAHPLVIIGAGPKALAIHTKALVLRGLGFDVPTVKIIEQREVGAHWGGRSGFTDGKMRLYTPPERDIGFPYDSVFGPEVNKRTAQYSWYSYLVATGRVAGHYGEAPRFPSHALFQEYLQWVASESKATTIVDSVKDVQLRKRDECWKMELQQRKTPLYACGIVVTGPGNPFKLKGQEGCSRVLGSREFWLEENVKKFTRLRRGRVAVIGAGPGAAAIILKLVEATSQSVMIHNYGIMKARSDKVDRFLSEAHKQNWYALSSDEREEIARALSGVLPSEMREIEQSGRVMNFPHLIKEVRQEKKSVFLKIAEMAGEEGGYDLVVVATGFSLTGWISLFRDKSVFGAKGRTIDKVAGLEDRVSMDLSIRGVRPFVHVPLLASRAHGPGLPTLNCLGLLSDNILRSYATPVTTSLAIAEASSEDNGKTETP